MPHIYIHPSFPLLTGGPTGPARITHPFWGEGDYTTIQIEQDWIQSWTTYKPLPLNTPIDFAKIKNTGFVMPPNASACIYLEDTEPQDIGFGCCQVTRRWGTVPIERREPTSASVNYFGQAFRSPSYQSVIGGSTTVNSPTIGERVYGIFSYSYRSGNWFFSFNTVDLRRKAEIIAISPSVVIGNDNGFSPSSTFQQYTFKGWTSLRSPSKGPRSRFVSCYTVKKYVIGLSAASFESLESLQITSSTGAVTDTMTETTEPTQTAWRSMINAGDYFIAQDTQTTRYKGDIYELSTLYAPAKW